MTKGMEELLDYNVGEITDVKIDNEVVNLQMLAQLIKENKELKEQLAKSEHRKHRREVTEEDRRRLATGIKSDGKPIATKKENIHSYSEIKRVNDYFLSNQRYRDYLIWILGIGCGFRESDIISLKLYNVYDFENRCIRDRIKIYEQKTSKIQNCLINEITKQAIELYLENEDCVPSTPESYLVTSRKSKCGLMPISKTQVYRVVSDVGRELHIESKNCLGSHTLRKTFATIAEVVCKKYGVSLPDTSIVQNLLNHSDARITQRYLGATQETLDVTRKLVSDFLLGKTGIETLDFCNEMEVEKC